EKLPRAIGGPNGPSGLVEQYDRISDQRIENRFDEFSARDCVLNAVMPSHRRLKHRYRSGHQPRLGAREIGIAQSAHQQDAYGPRLAETARGQPAVRRELHIAGAKEFPIRAGLMKFLAVEEFAGDAHGRTVAPPHAIVKIVAD